ncbi:MAG: SoxR reducing system RseC family protein, partial [Planctomycetota bacterium]
MKTEKGIIEKIESDAVLIKLKPDNPESCKSCSGCSSSSGSTHTLRLSMEDNPLLAHAKEGDTVTVEINLPNQAAAAALMFGLPLTNMIIGGIIARLLMPQSDPALLIGGAAGLTFGGIELAIISRIVPAFKRAIRVK